MLAEQVVGDRERRQVGGVLERAQTHRRGLGPRIDGAQLLSIGGVDRAVQRGVAGHATLEAPAVRLGVQDLAEQADLDQPPVVVDTAPPVVLERGNHAKGARCRALQANQRANLHGAGDLCFDHTPDQGTRDRDHPSDAGTGRGVGPGFEPRVQTGGRLEGGCRRLGAMIGAVAPFLVGAVRWRWCLRCRLPARAAGRCGHSGPLFRREGGVAGGSGRILLGARACLCRRVCLHARLGGAFRCRDFVPHGARGGRGFRRWRRFAGWRGEDWFSALAQPGAHRGPASASVGGLVGLRWRAPRRTGLPEHQTSGPPVQQPDAAG